MPGRALTRDRRLYEEAMYQVEMSFAAIASEVSAYWWNLYQIKQNAWWQCDFDTFEDWLGDFSVKPYGQSRASFFNVMGAIERFKRIGKTDEEVRELLGKRKVALEGDLKEMFLDGGRGAIRPEIQARLAAGGETVAQFVDRVADLAPGEARQAVRAVLRKDKVYVVEDQTAEVDGRLLLNMVWESEEDGILWNGTVTISGQEIVARRSRLTTAPHQLPPAITDYICSRLGIRR